MEPSKLPKLKIDHKGIEYEGVAAASAVGMAMMESSGIRELIDRSCSFDRAQRILSPGMGTKALIGPVFNLKNKSPLYIVHKNYASAPNDYIFGDDVRVASLNDDALGRTLDTLAEEDLEILFSKCSNLCVEKYGLDSQVLHDDSTNIPFYGMRHDDVAPGEIHPDHACSPKDHRRDLLHFCYQLTVNSNGIIRHMKAYSGNAADCIMDGDTIEFLSRTMTPKQLRNLVYVADSKLMTGPNMKMIRKNGMSFISRCPVNFGDSIQNLIVAKALVMRPTRSKRYPNLETYDIEEEVQVDDAIMNMRFVVTVDTDKRESISRSLLDEISTAKPLEKLIGKEFDSESELLEVIGSFEDPKLGGLYELVADIRTAEVEMKRRGRKPKDYVPMMKQIWYLASASLVPILECVALRATLDSMFVLATNLPTADADSEKYVDGMTSDGVVMLYREEYKVEHCFRFMKSGLGIDTVFLQTPSRERAMMFVLGIAALITGLADALLGRNAMEIDGRRATMYSLAVELLTTTIELDRSDCRLSVRGPTGVTERFFEYTDALAINPRYLLGHN